MDNLLNEAAHCPICDKVPVTTLEEGFCSLLTFLRCPAGHPYVCCGKNLVEAINNWNLYIQLRIQNDTAQMIAMVSKNINASYCRHCQKFTKSTMRFDKYSGDDSHLGHAINRQECQECHLIKSEREAA